MPRLHRSTNVCKRAISPPNTDCLMCMFDQFDIPPADEDKDKDDAPKMKKVKQKTEEWEQLNTQNAIWLRDPSDVAAEEYEKFYQAIAKARCWHGACLLEQQAGNLIRVYVETH